MGKASGWEKASYEARNCEEEVMMPMVGAKCLSKFWFITGKEKSYLFLISPMASDIRSR